MKKLFLVLVCVALAAFLFVGCLPGITPEEEEEVPVLVMEAVATAELIEVEEILEVLEILEILEIVEDSIVVTTEGVEGVEAVEGYWNVEWSIINTGDEFIREYTLTFKVDYPDITKDLVTFYVTKKYLEIGEFEKGTIKLAAYGNAAPKSVSVTWELFE